MNDYCWIGRPTEALYMPPGAFFMRRIGGWTGRWVSAAQAFVRGSSHFTHAGLVLDDDQIIEAEPGGARIKSISTLYSADLVLVSDAPVKRSMAGFWPNLLVRDQAEWTKRAEVVGKARYLEGVPYSFLDYVALGMAEWKLPGWQVARDRVESSKHLICSALVDRAYSWADIHLFTDGRTSGDVTPWDLERYAWESQANWMATAAKRSGS